MRPGLLATAAVGVTVALFYLIEALRYDRGTAAQPGPGLYPSMVGVLLMVAALGVGFDALGQSGRGIDWPAGSARWRVLAILLSTLAYVLLLPYLGHPLGGTLLTLIVLHVMGLRRWPVKIAAALAVGLGSHYAFAVLLGVPLPRGLWLE